MLTDTDANGAATLASDVVLPPIAGAVRPARPGWFTKLVAFSYRRALSKAAAKGKIADERSAHDQARSAITRACVKSAVSGAAAAGLTTAAELITAETEGLGGFVVGPIAALAIGLEMAYRATVHVDLSCSLATIFGVEFDAKDDADLWRLWALTFGAHAHDDESEDPGQDLVHKVSHVEAENVGEQIGHRVLGESVMRNVIPFVGVVTSAVANFITTKRLGDNVRRYMRYQRAMEDMSTFACDTCREHLDLLIEGMWFIFAADGKLAPEEATFLAHMLHRLEPLRRHATLQRFVEDELDWTERISAEVPEQIRDVFFRMLEVAAAMDKEVSLPERKILRRAARALGREFSQERIDKMIADLEDDGVLDDHWKPRPASPPASA